MKGLDPLLSEIETVRRLGGTVGEAGLSGWAESLRKLIAAEQRRWLSEDRAVRRGRHAVAWFRSRYAAWCEAGYARMGTDGKRQYHEAVIPVVASKEALARDPVEQARRDAA